ALLRGAAPSRRPLRVLPPPDERAPRRRRWARPGRAAVRRGARAGRPGGGDRRPPVLAARRRRRAAVLAVDARLAPARRRPAPRARACGLRVALGPAVRRYPHAPCR